jgi:hypothetical protein
VYDGGKLRGLVSEGFRVRESQVLRTLKIEEFGN